LHWNISTGRQMVKLTAAHSQLFFVNYKKNEKEKQNEKQTKEETQRTWKKN
jgi:hypothetical protein